MENRPFLCQKCGNWYIAVPVTNGTSCLLCDTGQHVASASTGTWDCHFGQTSATPSEIKMAGLLGKCQSLKAEAQAVLGRIGQSKRLEDVAAIVSKLEQSFSEAELAQAEMPEVLRWATVMELPGMLSSPREARFKSIEVIRSLVETHRRPPEDLTMLERSGRVCQEIAAEVPMALSDARLILGQVRQAAQAWTAPLPSAKAGKPLTSKTSKRRIGKRQLVNA